MRHKLVIGNWKMNGNRAANTALLSGIVAGLNDFGADCAVCVPAPYLAQCQAELAGTPVAWGGQDVSIHADGASQGAHCCCTRCWRRPVGGDLTAKVSEIKAPMPGLVLKVLVEEGAEIKKGDNLFVLEAMKMENIIKAPADVTIKTIKIKPGDKVEKGQILMMF